VDLDLSINDIGDGEDILGIGLILDYLLLTVYSLSLLTPAFQMTKL
jgi:hypothetical protein